MDDNHRTHGVEPLKTAATISTTPKRRKLQFAKRRIRPAYRDELNDHLQRLTSARAVDLSERIARLLAGEYSGNYSGHG